MKQFARNIGSMCSGLQYILAKVIVEIRAPNTNILRYCILHIYYIVLMNTAVTSTGTLSSV